MSYKSGFSRQRSRRQRQILTRFGLWLVVAAVFIGIGYSSYRSGALLARMGGGA